MKARNRPQRPVDDDVDDRATPPRTFSTWQSRWQFTVDAAAAPHNAKLPRYWTRETDGLIQTWAGERVWCNPPFSRIRPWVAKAWAETDCPLAVLLLPANRTEQGWWQDLIEPYRDQDGSPLKVEFLPGRMRFARAGQLDTRGDRPPFGICLAIWAGRHPGDMAPSAEGVQMRLNLAGEVS